MRLLYSWESVINRLCDQLMQFLAAALEQRLICGVANQCMLELIGRLRRDP